MRVAWRTFIHARLYRWARRKYMTGPVDMEIHVPLFGKVAQRKYSPLNAERVTYDWEDKK